LARVDLRRRAEIGRERRAKSRAQIIEAASVLFTSQPIASVTVEEVTNGAQVARGTFYSHFRTLDELRAAVATDLAAAFDNFADSIGLPAADPVARIAVGCAAFIGEAQRDPAWGVLIAGGAYAFPAVASAARERLKANLLLAKGEGRLASISSEVGFDLVFGVVVQAMRSAARRDYRPLTCRTWSAEFCARSELGRRNRSRSHAHRRPREISSDGGNLGYQPRSV
jgi:AcrR family transcriptional regulator